MLEGDSPLALVDHTALFIEGFSSALLLRSPHLPPPLESNQLYQ